MIFHQSRASSIVGHSNSGLSIIFSILGTFPCCFSNQTFSLSSLLSFLSALFPYFHCSLLTLLSLYSLHSFSRVSFLLHDLCSQVTFTAVSRGQRSARQGHQEGWPAWTLDNVITLLGANCGSQRWGCLYFQASWHFSSKCTVNGACLHFVSSTSSQQCFLFNNHIYHFINFPLHTTWCGLCSVELEHHCGLTSYTL